MKKASRRNLLTLVALSILAPLSAEAGAGLSSSAQLRLPAHSAFAGLNRILFPSSPYMIDDGTAEDTIGLTAGGDLICLNEFAVIPGQEIIGTVSLAWGSPLFPDATLNGLPYTAIIWSDPNGDGNPTDAVVLATASGVIANAGTDTFIDTHLPITAVTTPNFFVGFIISQGAEVYPAAFDETLPNFSNRSYVTGGAQGDYYNLNNNDLPLMPVEGYGLPGNWLIRAGAPFQELTVYSVVSRKVQRNFASFDILLPPDGLGIEDRDTPTDDIIFEIGAELTSLDSASVSCGTIVYAGVQRVNAHNIEVEVDATGCDQQVITVTIHGVHDQLGNFLATDSANYGKLIGDVDGNGVVNFADVAAVRAGLGQRVTADTFRLDVNADGSVSGHDYSIVKASKRHALP